MYSLWANLSSRYKLKKFIPNLEVLKTCPLFKNLTKRELKIVSNLIYERSYQTDEFLFEMGQPGAAMFIVKTGRINVVMGNAHENGILLATMQPEDFLGELALLDDSPRSATAIAMQKTEVLAFYREDLNNMMEIYPVISSKIMRELSKIIGMRLRMLNEDLLLRSRLSEKNDRRERQSA